MDPSLDHGTYGTIDPSTCSCPSNPLGSPRLWMPDHGYVTVMPQSFVWKFKKIYMMENGCSSMFILLFCRMCVRVCVCLCVHVYIWKHIYSCMHTYAYMHIYIYIYLYLYTCAYVNIIYIYTYRYTYIYIYTYYVRYMHTKKIPCPPGRKCRKQNKSTITNQWPIGKFLRCRSNEVLKLWGASTNKQMMLGMPLKWHERSHAQLIEWTNTPMNLWFNQWMHEHWITGSMIR